MKHASKRQLRRIRMGETFNPAQAWQTMYVGMVKRAGDMRSAIDPKYQLLKFLISPTNRQRGMFDFNSIQAQLDRGDGKRYRVIRNFYPHKKITDFGLGERNYCGTGGDCNNPYKQDTVEIGYSYASPVLCVDQNEWRTIVENGAKHLDDRVMEHFRSMEEAFHAIVSKRVVTGGFVGKFGNGQDEAEIPLIMANGKAVNPVGEIVINKLLTESMVNDSAVLVGGDIANAYPVLRGIAAANVFQGFDVTRQQGTTPVIYDSMIPQGLGDTDKALLIRPGALQLFTHNRHKGGFVDTDDPNSKRYTMISPFTGLEWDVIWTRTRDCDTGDFKWSLQYAIDWDVVGIPACWTDDSTLQGITDVFKVKVVCSDDGVCDLDRYTGRYDIDLVPVAKGTLTDKEGYEVCNAGACKVVLNTRKYVNMRRHALSTTSTDEAVGIVIDGVAYNFADPITLGSTGAATLLAAAIQDVLGSNGIVTANGFATSTTTVSLFTADTIVQIELVLDGTNNVEFTSVPYAKVCRVTTDAYASAGATVSSITITDGTTTITGAATAAVTGVTGIEGKKGDFFAYGSPAIAFAAQITATVTDSSSCTSTATGYLCD